MFDHYINMVVWHGGSCREGRLSKDNRAVSKDKKGQNRAKKK